MHGLERGGGGGVCEKAKFSPCVGKAYAQKEAQSPCLGMTQSYALISFVSVVCSLMRFVCFLSPFVPIL